jgi:mono/diheme cytochrome c family protein
MSAEQSLAPRHLLRRMRFRFRGSLSRALLAPLLVLWVVSCQQRQTEGGAEPGGEAGGGQAETSPAAAPDTPPTPEGTAADTPTTAGPGASDTPTVRADTPAAEADTPATGADTGRAAAGEEQTAEGAGEGGQAAGQVVNGWKQYAVNCERCHGQDALGSALAPDLRKSAQALGHDGFIQIVREGRQAKGMPPFGEVLDAGQMEDIYAYVVARGTGELGPGRPEGS